MRQKTKSKIINLVNYQYELDGEKVKKKGFKKLLKTARRKEKGRNGGPRSRSKAEKNRDERVSGDYFKSWRQHFIMVEARSRRSVNYVGRNHFLPVGQLPNLKGIALHGSPVTELIFFQSNCVSSRSPTTPPPSEPYFHTPEKFTRPAETGEPRAPSTRAIRRLPR